MSARHVARVSSLLLAGLLITACSDGASSGSAAPQVITVSAAASLTDAFTEIGAAYSASHSGVDVRFNFGGSSTLAEQINAGAPVDVFAAASDRAMQTTLDAGTVGPPVIFTRNSMAIALPVGNPADITSLADLADPDVTVVVCNEPVPCGSAARAVFDTSGLTVTPASLEPDVRAVLTKVISDEADAGIVYRSDIAAAGDTVESIDIPDSVNAVNEYPIAATTDAAMQAQDFIDFVLSDAGQSILTRWGFTSR